jgi:hypothetical protein
VAKLCFGMQVAVEQEKHSRGRRDWFSSREVGCMPSACEFQRNRLSRPEEWLYREVRDSRSTFCNLTQNSRACFAE